MAKRKYKITMKHDGLAEVILTDVDLMNGRRIMIYKPTDEPVISSVTGKILGKHETVIGVGKIRDGKVSLRNREGKVIEAVISDINATPTVLSNALGVKKHHVRVSSPDSQLKVKLIEE